MVGGIGRETGKRATPVFEMRKVQREDEREVCHEAMVEFVVEEKLLYQGVEDGGESPEAAAEIGVGAEVIPVEVMIEVSAQVVVVIGVPRDHPERLIQVTVQNPLE